VPVAYAAGDHVATEGHQLHAQHISSVVQAAAGTEADSTDSTSSSDVRQLAPSQQQQQQQQSAGSHPKLSIAAKLRPCSADDVAAHGSSSSSSTWPCSAAGSGSQQRQPGRRPLPCSAGPAGSHTNGPSSGSLLGGSRAGRGPGSLAGYAAFAASCSAKAAAHLADYCNITAAVKAAADAGCDSPGPAQEATDLRPPEDAGSSNAGSDAALGCDLAEQQQQQAATAAGIQLAASAAAPSPHALTAPSAAEAAGQPVVDEQATADMQQAAAATAATQAAPAERYQGPLALAAVACGLMLPAAADTTTEGCPAHYCASGVFLPAGAADAGGCTAAAAAGGGVPISAAELEAYYLQARQAGVNADR
jgi:hypothetical protein